MDKVIGEKNKIQREYQELQDMYNSLKEQELESEKLNDESQKIISNLEVQAKEFKK